MKEGEVKRGTERMPNGQHRNSVEMTDVATKLFLPCISRARSVSLFSVARLIPTFLLPLNSLPSSTAHNLESKASIAIRSVFANTKH